MAAAVVPALLAAMLVTNAGLMFIRMSLSGGFRLGEGTVLRLSTDPAAVAPELLWPVWGAALTAAALAYYYRRRGVCPHCGRGEASDAGGARPGAEHGGAALHVRDGAQPAA
jgi:hypothetical protein